MSLHKSKDPNAELCPIRDVLHRLGDRWSILVLFSLGDHGTTRFTVLKARIEDVSQRMLAQTLRRLEQDGVVSRTVYASIPPRVDYALTPLGQSLLEPLIGLREWALRNHDRVRAARATYAPIAASREAA